MVDKNYQYELKVRPAVAIAEPRMWLNQDPAAPRYTLSLSATGDLQLVSGTDKLATQLVRTVVNDNTLVTNLLNQRMITQRELISLFTTILRQFREVQLNEVGRSDEDLLGFILYRRAAGSSDAYAKVSPDALQYSFVDSGLTNFQSYQYAVTKLFSGGFESAITETMTLMPTSTPSEQKVTIGSEIVGWAGSKQVTFYFDTTRIFKGSELLDRILYIDAQERASDPRFWQVNIKVEDLREQPVSLSTTRMKASGAP